jgi:pilus assembly protein CpaB
MGTRRLGIALIAALLISLVMTSFFYVRISRTQAGARPKTRRVVAAAVALQPGTPITAENLTEINWPENVQLQGLLNKKEEVVGHVLMYGVAANQPVMRRDLAASTSLGLAAKIPDGMRATAVKTNEITNVAGFIFPGSRVDVLVTLKPENNTASTETRTVLQNVQVLSTGTKMDPDPNGKPENVNVVTLLVTPEQSEKLALSQAQGTIHFALRNGADSVNSDVAPVDLAQLAGIPKKSPHAEMPRPKQPAVAVAAKPPTPEFYTIETIANGKTTIAKFPIKAE